MIPFVLGIICGVASAVMLWALCRAMSNMDRLEERWMREKEEDEIIRFTVHELQEQETGMSSALRELHRLEEEARRREGRSEAREAHD